MGEVEIAVLAQRVNTLESDQSEIRKDVRWLRQEMQTLITTAKTLRWVVTIALPLGPALGVALARLFQ